MKRYYDYKENNCTLLYDAKEDVIKNFKSDLNIIMNILSLYLKGVKRVKIELVNHAYIDNNWHTKFKVTGLPDKKQFLYLEFVGEDIVLSYGAMKTTFKLIDTSIEVKKLEYYLSDRVIIQEILNHIYNIIVIFGGKVFRMEIPCDNMYTLPEPLLMGIKENHSIFDLKRFYFDHLTSLQSNYDLGQITKIEILERENDKYVPLNYFYIRNREIESYLFSVKSGETIMSAEGLLNKDPVYTVSHFSGGVNLNRMILELNNQISNLSKSRQI